MSPNVGHSTALVVVEDFIHTFTLGAGGRKKKVTQGKREKKKSPRDELVSSDLHRFSVACTPLHKIKKINITEKYIQERKPPGSHNLALCYQNCFERASQSCWALGEIMEAFGTEKASNFYLFIWGSGLSLRISVEIYAKFEVLSLKQTNKTRLPLLEAPLSLQSPPKYLLYNPNMFLPNRFFTNTVLTQLTKL